jgi:hypothetical protein
MELPDIDPGILARMAVKDAAPRRLAYYASQLPNKETWFQTDEGYRVYKNVPICRTGTQQYVGREIKNNPGYRDEWNIGDDDLVTVYRTIEEVTAPAAIASFEAKSVLDEHPPDPQILVDAIDEYDGVSMGHGQNVREGGRLADGETCVVADLWVKHPELNIKIDGGVRDVSCGYTFRLDKDEDGRYIQREIRGNHIAIVPKGRAGTLVGIKDSQPESESKGILTMADLISLGLHTLAKTATVDEFSAAVQPLIKTQGVKDSAVKDADEDEEKQRMKEKEDADKASKDKAAKDKAAKDAEHDPKTCDVEDCAKCKAAADEEFGADEMTDKGAKDDDGNAAILPADELSRTTFAVGDAAKLLDVLKPAIAKSKSAAVKDAYTKLRTGIRSVRLGVKDGAPDPFLALTRINASGGINDADDEELPATAFFNGKSYTEGLKSYNEYLTARQSRTR